LRSTFDTAAVETPACLATSAIVTRRTASCDFIMRSYSITIYTQQV
jgi:hypothetical protein